MLACLREHGKTEVAEIVAELVEKMESYTPSEMAVITKKAMEIKVRGELYPARLF